MVRQHHQLNEHEFEQTLVAQLVKNPPAMQETYVQSLDWEDAFEKGKATHSTSGEFHRQSIGSQRVGHD